MQENFGERNTCEGQWMCAGQLEKISDCKAGLTTVGEKAGQLTRKSLTAVCYKKVSVRPMESMTQSQAHQKIPVSCRNGPTFASLLHSVTLGTALGIPGLVQMHCQIQREAAGTNSQLYCMSSISEQCVLCLLLTLDFLLSLSRVLVQFNRNKLTPLSVLISLPIYLLNAWIIPLQWSSFLTGLFGITWISWGFLRSRH